MAGRDRDTPLMRQIHRLQEKADALKGKSGYLVALERLKNAKLAVLASRKTQS